jgi:cellulose synthase/poly-beta-1,6-N-acetylglucosamine synthase-like glycosyltransferase
LITKLQAMAIDAHFMVEQTARSVSGLLMNFNGSGGIWRKACIIDSGGWLSRTLTEDLDLSYRAQLHGWKFDYLPDVVVPGELPVQISAYKQQQSRWAQGSLQTARKLLKPLLFSKLSIRQKIMGSLHLMHYLVHPLILISIITTFFFQSLSPINTLWFPVIMISILISPLLYLTCPAPETPNYYKRIFLIPPLMLLSVGISINNSIAAFRGLVEAQDAKFIRTPKYSVKNSEDRWERGAYILHNKTWLTLEFLAAGLVMSCVFYEFNNGNYYLIPWMLFYCLGFSIIAYISYADWKIEKRFWTEEQVSSGKKG